MESSNFAMIGAVMLLVGSVSACSGDGGASDSGYGASECRYENSCNGGYGSTNDPGVDVGPGPHAGTWDKDH